MMDKLNMVKVNKVTILYKMIMILRRMLDWMLFLIFGKIFAIVIRPMKVTTLETKGKEKPQAHLINLISIMVFSMIRVKRKGK